MTEESFRHAREALTRFGAAVKVFGKIQIPEPQASGRVVAALSAGGTPPRPPEDSVLDRAREALLAAGGDFASVPRKYMREAPWLLWSKDRPLAALRGLLDTVVALALRLRSVRRKLIQAWLLGFANGAPRIEEGGHAIRRLLADSPDMGLDPWRRAEQALSLFDARLGPRRVATAILMSSRPVELIMGVAGLRDPLQASGGYARAVHGEVLDHFAGALQKGNPDDVVARGLGFLAPGGRLRFEDAEAMGAVARGLLGPWLRGGSPSDSVRTEIQGFLLRNLGDPRIRPQGWREAGSDATGLMRRWLDRASFEAFFELIGEHSPEEQFQYRKAFWSAYLEKNAISRIWIALGSQIHSSARAVRELNGAYGRLSGAGGRDAVLLMQAGDVVLCEWSRVGALRAWDRKWRSAPRLDAPEYLASDLRGKGMDFPAGRVWAHPGFSPRRKPTTGGTGLWHDSPEKGYWQSSAAEFMARHTGVHLSPSDWMPR